MQFLLKNSKQNPLLNLFIGVMFLVGIIYVLFRANSVTNLDNIEGSNAVVQSVQDLSQLKNISPLFVGDVIIEVSTTNSIIINFNKDTYDENIYSAYSILKSYGIAPDDSRIVEVVND